MDGLGDFGNFSFLKRKNIRFNKYKTSGENWREKIANLSTPGHSRSGIKGLNRI